VKARGGARLSPGTFGDPPHTLLPTHISLKKKTLEFVWPVKYGHHCILMCIITSKSNVRVAYRWASSNRASLFASHPFRNTGCWCGFQLGKLIKRLARRYPQNQYFEGPNLSAGGRIRGRGMLMRGAGELLEAKGSDRRQAPPLQGEGRRLAQRACLRDQSRDRLATSNVTYESGPRKETHWGIETSGALFCPLIGMWLNGDTVQIGSAAHFSLSDQLILTFRVLTPSSSSPSEQGSGKFW